MSFYLEFSRTECSCSECVACCRRQPGPLAPGDLERIAEFLGESTVEARRHFMASKGALVANSSTGRTFRVGTITPKRDERGACVFLTPEGLCSVHPVAPTGCSYFDTHMGLVEARKRASGLVRLQQRDDYQRLRASLTTRGESE